MKAYVGTSGWQYKHWNARFFPEDLPKKDWLPFLASKFKTVEVNTTFYHMARVSTFQKWKQEVPPGFLFTLKFYRLFTHFKKLNFEKQDLETLEAFFRNGAKLGRKLGPILVQFPPSLGVNLEKLGFLLSEVRKIEKKLKKKFKIACEFRHKTWFTEEVYEFMRQQKAAFVITNSPAWPSQVIKTADFVYMRFHGRTKLFASNYTEKELEQWAKILKALKAKEVYAYFNNDANAYAADNAQYLKKLLDS
ncbi:MAG: DUF72 domain-containing protein [Candidatus Doudnabacteria bacterium]|nr:DUF72 domain-containing protein [Candidatus Doudnabacteria bacterium]